MVQQSRLLGYNPAMSTDDAIETEYKCPLCGRKVVRDLALFLEHTNQHVIDKIKSNHPEWIESDGACAPCVDYYKKALSGDPSLANIGPEGRQKRTVMAFLLFTVSLGTAFYFHETHASILFRALIFFPFFTGIFCALQAKARTCAILAQAGVQDLGQGEEKIKNPETAEILRARGRKIWKNSFVFAVLLTGFYLFLSQIL